MVQSVMSDEKIGKNHVPTCLIFAGRVTIVNAYTYEFLQKR